QGAELGASGLLSLGYSQAESNSGLGVRQVLQPVRNRQRAPRHLLQAECPKHDQGLRRRADRRWGRLPGICRSAEETARPLTTELVVSRRKPGFQFLLRAALPRASWIPAHAGMMALVPSPVSRVMEEVERGICADCQLRCVHPWVDESTNPRCCGFAP